MEDHKADSDFSILVRAVEIRVHEIHRRRRGEESHVFFVQVESNALFAEEISKAVEFPWCPSEPFTPGEPGSEELERPNFMKHALHFTDVVTELSFISVPNSVEPHDH